MLTEKQKEHVKECNEFYVGNDFNYDIGLLLLTIQDLQEELRIGNHLCAEQCNKINDLENKIVELKLRLKPVMDMYEEFKIHDTIINSLSSDLTSHAALKYFWSAIKQAAESEANNETKNINT